jgi:uncharacterized protein (UPF0332 family)
MRYKRPDAKNALSLVEAARRKMRFTLSLELTEDSAATIASNIYESFRMLGDALFVKMGVMQRDHKEVIEELVKLEVDTQRPTQSIKNLRQLRHNINYYGYEPRLPEVEDAIDIAELCFDSLAEKVENTIHEK